MMYKIGEVFTLIRNGANIKQGEDDTGYPITRIETISNRVVDRNKMGHAGIHEIDRYSDYVLQDGDILMSHINSEAHLGKVALYEKMPDETIIHGMNLLCLRPNRQIIDCRYAFYFLLSDSFLRQIPRITKKSVNQASFNVAALKELQIHVPPMEQQLQIVGVMDKIQKVLLQRQEQSAAMDQLVKSRFIELFGDPVADSMKWGQLPLSYYLKSIRYGTSTPPSFSETGYEFIRATNIKNGQILSSDMKYISEEEAKKIEKCKVIGGEMIIVRSGVNAGDTCIITGEHCGQYAGYDMILVFGEALHPVFANVLINTEYMDRVVKPLTRRAAQPHLNSEQVQSLPIIQVPYAQQEQFAAFVEQTDKSKLAVQQGLQELELLKKSLMQQYFG